MNIVDCIIIVILITGAVNGFKNGFLPTLASFIGSIAVIVLAFMFKDSVSVFLYENMPFANFGGAVKGIQVINVVFYEVLAFLILFVMLLIIYRSILMMTGILENIVKLTIIFKLPSKILGIFVGIVQYYAYIYIALFLLSIPMFHIKEIHESKYGDKILLETPVISDYSKESLDIYDKLYDIIKTRKDKTNEQLNKETLELMLDNKFITYQSAKRLVDENKVYLDDKAFLEKYK